ncbi:MAG TPA: DUF2892 domain-containing protein [Gemmatimonadales bacterium]|nr:DUF2892 domain-containing protein [Gemmatimonadales bacterium]
MTSFMNEAGWDRALRIVVGVVLLYLGWAGIIGGTLAWRSGSWVFCRS